MFSRWRLELVLGISLLSLYLLYLITTPIWHGPDEQVHFSQLAFRGEMGRFQNGPEADVTREIYESTGLLGTLRDKQGNNSYTFRPQYNLEYTDSLTGVYEQEIRSLANEETRSDMVGADASHYPKFYYRIGATLYRMFYESSIFERVFGVRVWSLVLGIGTVGVAYLIGLKIFKKKLEALALGALVGFQPMFMHVSTSVTSDAAFNWVYSVGLLAGVMIVLKGNNLWSWGLVMISLYLAEWTKPQWVLLIPTLILAILIRLWWNYGKDIRWWKQLLGGLGLLVLGIFVGVAVWNYLRVAGHLPEVSGTNRTGYGWWDHVKYVQFHTYREVIPWYWGVFKWLGVTLPRWTHRIQMSILSLSSFGILIWVWKLVREKLTVEKLGLLFLWLSAGIYFVGIEVWEYFFIADRGYVFGIQGRYFFPTIIGHMALLLVGFQSLWFSKKWLGVGVLISWWLVLAWIGWATLAGAYYDLEWPKLITQMSQYKPYWVKGWGLVGILMAAFVTGLLWLGWWWNEIIRKYKVTR